MHLLFKSKDKQRVFNTAIQGTTFAGANIMNTFSVILSEKLKDLVLPKCTCKEKTLWHDHHKNILLSSFVASVHRYSNIAATIIQMTGVSVHYIVALSVLYTIVLFSSLQLLMKTTLLLAICTARVSKLKLVDQLLCKKKSQSKCP